MKQQNACNKSVSCSDCLGCPQVLQRLHESPNAAQALRAVFIAKASICYFSALQ